MSRMKSAALVMLGSAMLGGQSVLNEPIPYSNYYVDDMPMRKRTQKSKYHHNRTLNQRQRRKLERQMPHKRK